MMTDTPPRPDSRPTIITSRTKMATKNKVILIALCPVVALLVGLSERWHPAPNPVTPSYNNTPYLNAAVVRQVKADGTDPAATNADCHALASAGNYLCYVYEGGGSYFDGTWAVTVTADGRSFILAEVT